MRREVKTLGKLGEIGLPAEDHSEEKLVWTSTLSAPGGMIRHVVGDGVNNLLVCAADAKRPFVSASETVYSNP